MSVVKLFSRLSTLVAFAIFLIFIGTAGDLSAGNASACQDFSGAWHTKDLAASEMRISQRGCALEGVFKAANAGSQKKLKHSLNATAVGSTATGWVTRTDSTGCKAQIKIALSMEGDKFVYRTIETDGKCELPVEFTESREWLRVSSTRQSLAFLCPSCGQEMGRCAGNVPGARCTYCSSPSGQCRCPICGKRFYEASHAHN